MSGSYVDVYFRDLSSDRLFYYRSFYCQARTTHGFARFITRLRPLCREDLVSVSHFLPETYDLSHAYFSTIDGVFEVVKDNPVVLVPGIKINPADRKIYEV